MSTDRRRRFCMVTTFYPPYNFGGDGIFVHRLANELARRGHRVDVVHNPDAYRVLAGAEPEQPYHDHPNVTVHTLQSSFGSLSLLLAHQAGSSPGQARHLREILSSPYDVIHYHNVSLAGGPKALEYGRAVKLYTMHEYWLVCPTHTLFRFERATCVTQRCVACTLSYRRPPQWWRYSGMLRSAVACVDRFIAPSRFSADVHRQRGLDRPIVHLPYFVPHAESGPEPSDDPAAENPYFLFVGRLEKLKGLQTVIPLFRHFEKAQLWIVGTGRYEATLRGLAAGSPNIRFLGYQSSAALRALYRRAVALVVPSIWFEVVGQVLIEAFRERTPAIARNLGGMPELIAASGGGFAYDTEEALIAALDRLASDAQVRRTMGQRAYDAYLRNWTPEVHLERYLALIDEIEESPRP